MDGMLGRVLCAEDDPQLSSMYGEMLSDLGWEVGLAANGMEALAMATSESWDVLMTDLHMPVLDGYGLIRQLRAAKPGFPIIVVSGNPGPAGPDLIAENGLPPIPLLLKPMHFSELDALLRAAAGSQAA